MPRKACDAATIRQRNPQRQAKKRPRSDIDQVTRGSTNNSKPHRETPFRNELLGEYNNKLVHGRHRYMVANGVDREGHGKKRVRSFPDQVGEKGQSSRGRFNTSRQPSLDLSLDGTYKSMALRQPHRVAAIRQLHLEQQNKQRAITDWKETKKTLPKRLRRRNNGSPIVPLDTKMPKKKIYLIRHGQSLGQTAKETGLDRKNDESLLDCGLTTKGELQSRNIGQFLSAKEMNSIQLIVTSPLTRALRTSLLAFPDKNLIVNYDLREIGLKVPENKPRAMKHVLKDNYDLLSNRKAELLFDFSSLTPSDWPRDHSPIVVRKDRLRRVFQWLYHEREENVIAIVCHHNVIRSAVTDGEGVRPENGLPISCSLFSNGEVVVDER